MTAVTPLLNSHLGPADAIMVARFYVPVNAQFCRQSLESLDIPAWLGDENTFAVHNWYTATGFFVRPCDVPEAMRVLHDLWDNSEESCRLIEYMSTDDADGSVAETEPTEPCPNCGGASVCELDRAPRPLWQRLLERIWVLFSIAFMLILPKPHHTPNKHCPDCDWEW